MQADDVYASSLFASLHTSSVHVRLRIVPLYGLDAASYKRTRCDGIARSFGESLQLRHAGSTVLCCTVQALHNEHYFTCDAMCEANEPSCQLWSVILVSLLFSCQFILGTICTNKCSRALYSHALLQLHLLAKYRIVLSLHGSWMTALQSSYNDIVVVMCSWWLLAGKHCCPSGISV